MEKCSNYSRTNFNFPCRFRTNYEWGFSESFQPQHGQWSEVIFYNIFIAELLVNVPLLFNPNFKKIIAIMGLIAAGLNAFFVIGFDLFYSGYFLEWVAISFAEAWLGLITINIFFNEVWSKKE